MTFNSSEFLALKGISRTAFREEVLSILHHSDVALSTKEIEDKLEQTPDRVTFYRTIKLFEEKKTIHKIVLEDQSTKYRIIYEADKIHHPHFHCLLCNKVVCLPEMPLPQCTLPNGFTIQTQNTIVAGACEKCTF